MKKRMITATLIAALASFQIACEKDVAEPTANNNQIVTQKVKKQNNKSSDFDYELYDDYISDLETASTPDDQDWEQALLLLESAVNHTEGTLGEVSTHSEIVSFSAMVYLSEGEEDLIVEGEDALDFYEDIIEELNIAFNNSNLYATYGTDAFVSAIDLHISASPSTAGALEVDGSGMVKFNLEPDYPYCSANNNWKALDQLGFCTSGGTGLDAAMRIESMLTRQSCNSSLAPAYCTAYYVSNVTFVQENGFNTSNLWNGTASSNCISSGAINSTWKPGAITQANSMKPAYDIAQIDYAMSGLFGVNTAGHKLTVSYAYVGCPAVDPL